MFRELLIASLITACVHGAPSPPSTPRFFNNVTVFAPPESWASHSTSYARSVLLDQNCEKDNVLLASWTFSPPDGPYLPIAKSTDDGYSWTEISRVYFTHGNYTGGIILQPFLFELPQQVGKYPAGTILATGNAIPANFASTNIELYASQDKGLTWEFVSVVATGGAPNTDNGATPVWEPFIGIYDNQVLVYYSDQRDPLHGQKLSLQTSHNLLQWGGVINAVAFANYTQRPGMATVAQIGNGKWMISHEVGLAPQGDLAPYAVHYSIADSPLEFGSAPSHLLQARNTGTISSAGPYTVWTPAGGPDGTIVVSDSTYAQVFINTNNGDPDSWDEVETGLGVSYTRGLRVMPNESVILFMNGGYYGLPAATVTAGEWLVPGPPSSKDTISSCKNSHGH